MTMIKKILLALFMFLSLAAMSTVVSAEEKAEAAKPAETAKVAEAKAETVILHIEKALEEVKKSDFSAATLHLKEARHVSAKLEGSADVVKKGFDKINDGMKEVKFGDVEKATADLNAAIGFYKQVK